MSSALECASVFCFGKPAVSKINPESIHLPMVVPFPFGDWDQSKVQCRSEFDGIKV